MTLIPLLDTHQHLIYPERYAYTWTIGIPRLEGRAFRYYDYLAEAADCGITSTVFMETTAADPAGHDETGFVNSVASATAAVIEGIVAAGWPDSELFASELEGFKGTRVVGVRRVLHVARDELSQDPRFRENLRSLTDYGLTFDLCVLARQLPIAIELVQACPEVEFVLDHCGGPNVSAGALDPWRQHLSRLAEQPNVTCKISGVLSYCDSGHADRDAVRPFIEHSIETFGWDRVVWGSDWPVVETTSSLRDWVAISREIVAGEPEVNQRKLFHENGRHIYHLKGHDG